MAGNAMHVRAIAAALVLVFSVVDMSKLTA